MAPLDVILESDEEPEESCSEKLQRFLFTAQAHENVPRLSAMFNAGFPFQSVIQSCRIALRETELEYERIVARNILIIQGERYVHPGDFASDRIQKRRLNRSLEKLPNDSVVEEICSVHGKKCRLVQFTYGYLCYLHLLTEDTGPQTDDLPSSQVAIEDDGADEEVAINIEEERVEAEKAVFPAVPGDERLVSFADTLDNENQQGDLSLACFPSFTMDDQCEYLLLRDIMHHFNIREDYCLAALANFSEADMGWIEDGNDKYLLIDSAVQDSEYRSAKDILDELFNEASAYEAELPSEEEAATILDRLRLTDMGKDTSQWLGEESKSTIPLWTRAMVEGDENQLVSRVPSFFFAHINKAVASTLSIKRSTLLPGFRFLLFA